MTMKARLFGRRVLGPINKLDNPQINSPIDISVTSLMNLDMIGVTKDMTQKLADMIQNTNPCKRTSSLKSSSLKDNTGSK